MESYPPSKRPRLDRGDFIENLEANQTHTYIDITPHENLQYGTSMYQHYDVHEPQFINNGTSNHDLLVPPKPTTSTMPSFDLMPMPDYLPSDEEYSFAHNNLYSTNLNQLMPNSHPVAGEHYYPSNHTNHNIPAYGYPNSSLPAHIQSAPSPNAPQIYVSQQHVATPTTIVDSAQIHINHPPPTPTVPAPVPSPIQSQPLLNESPSPSNSGSPGGSRSVSSPDHGPQLQRKSEVASSEEDLGFKLFCENPLVLVNYQSPYIRKQMNITLTKLFLCESDFDEHEGTITLWKFRDNTVMLGNPALFPQVPPVVLEPSMVIHSDIVSRVFSDDKCLYTVSGGDSLWLNWWNLSTFQETRLNITPKLGPLNIELPVTVTAGHVDKDFIYIATMRGHILILDKAHKKINKVLKLKSLSFAHSLTSGEKYLYAAYTDASVRLWYKTRNWRKKKHICVDKTNKTPVRGIELDEAKSYFAFSRLLQVSNKINKQLLEYGTVRFDQDVQCITSDKDFLYIAFIGRIEIRAKQSLELVKSLQLQNQNAIRWIKTDEKYLYVDSHPLVVYNKETLTPITIMGEASLDKNSGVRYTLCNHKVIIGGCKNGNVMIWRRDANVLIADLPPIRSSGETDTSQQAVTCMSMAGDLIYVGHYSGLVRIINRLSYQQDVVYIQQSSSDSAMQLGHVTSIFCDSEILVVGYSTGRVYSIAVADLMVGDTTNAMDNNARKSVLLTGGAPEDPTPILAPELLHQPPAHVVKISRSGPYLCLLSTNGHVLLYDIKSPSTPQKISTLSYGGFSANTSFYVDDEHVYVSAEETHAPSPNSQLMGGGPIKKSLVKIWNFHNLNEPFTLKTDHSEAIFSLFSDEYYLFTCTRRGELKIWSKTPTKHGRQLPANDFSDLGTSPENNDMSHMMNNWRVGSPPTNRDGNGRSIRANGLAAQGGLNPQSEQHTQSTDVNMNGDQSSNGVCDGPFGQVKTTQCNWREIECFSRMQFSMITGETFLPAFSLGDHKYINPIEFQSRAQIEVNSQTQSLVNNDNDSTIVVSRMLNKDGRLPQEFIPKGSVFSQEETPGFVVTPNIIFKNS